jgi:hypothetical protein
MIDYSRAYHHGVLVPDIDAAMAEMGEPLGLEWCELQHREQQVWTPENGTHGIDLRFTYSAGTGQHLELLQGAPGSIWDANVHGAGVHHIGVWSDDVGGETAALIAHGWTLRMASHPPDAGFGAFTYVQPHSGLIVELVTTAVRPMFERWYAGGALA